MHARRMLLAGISLGIAFLVLTTAVSADTWPRFRGPNGEGIAQNQNIPVKWTKENILWKKPLAGDGNSSPVVWNDYLFIQSASKDGSQRLLICLHSKTGKQLWSKSLSGDKAIVHKKNTYASSTPATDGERVYACFWDGKDLLMTAYDFEGNQLWKRDLGGFTSQHGAGASPVLFQDKVILLNDQDGKAALIALNGKTGEPAWEAPRPHYRACYGAPFLWNKDGKQELVVVSTHEVTGYDPYNGTKNWHWDWKHSTKMPMRVTASPVFAGNMIFGCSGDGSGDRGMIALEVFGNGKATKLAWTNKKDFPYVPSMLAYQDHLYFVNDLGMAGCFEAKTGKKKWFERLTEAAVGFTSSPVLIDGKIYAADEEGDVHVLAATPEFQQLARNPLGERVRATPAVANQKLYIRGKDHLFCIGQS